jgi:hypothetical protein
VLRVLVQRRHGAGWPKPGVDAAHGAALPERAVVWGQDVSRQRGHLLKQLVLREVQQATAAAAVRPWPPLLLLLLLRCWSDSRTSACSQSDRTGTHTAVL